MKRKFYIGGLVAAFITIFLCENRFLFSFRSIRPGMDEAQVQARLGKPWMWCGHGRPSDYGISDAQWENSIGCDGEKYWRYTLSFCGIHFFRLGECHVKFHHGKVVRISFQSHFVSNDEQKWPELPLKLPSGDTIFLYDTQGFATSGGERLFWIQYKTAIASFDLKDHRAQMKEVVRVFQDQADKAGIKVMYLQPMFPLTKIPKASVPEVQWDKRKTASGEIEIIPQPLPKSPNRVEYCAYEIRKTPSGEWLRPHDPLW
ncbi:MAG: hypothetical protein WCO68_08900 [Verrucomicrobiota bacterium]